MVCADVFVSQYAIKRDFGPNLFSLYNPGQDDPIFQIDANLGFSGALLVSCKHVAYFVIHVSKHLTTHLFRTDFYNHLM